MRHQQGFASRLARAGVAVATALVLSFSTVPAAHADETAPTQSDTPSNTPIPAEAPASAPNEAPKGSSPKGDAPAKAPKSVAPQDDASAKAPKSVAPQSVPRASGDNAVITVKVGGDRTSETNVKGLAGVKLR